MFDTDAIFPYHEARKCIIGFAVKIYAAEDLIVERNVGLGTTAPAEKSCAVKVSNASSPYTSSNAGAIKFVSPDFWGCNGTTWVQLNNN